jgi:hypothetical protein
MEALVKAARIMNPRQFELPREMKIPCLFPGTEKGKPFKIYLQYFTKITLSYYMPR